MNVAQLGTLRAEAENGDADSQYQLGFLYMTGRGVTRDYKLASEWYKNAARKGHSRAQFSLGVMYFRGRGAARDYVEAKYWLGKARENGNTEAEALMKDIDGLIAEQKRTHSDTQNTPPKTDTEATQGKPVEVPKRSWLRIAAIAVMVIAGGLGVYLSDVEHRARFGFADAQAQLGSYYEQGTNGYRKDLSQAAYWYKLAAQKGHRESQYNLGIMYYSGRGVEQI